MNPTETLNEAIATLETLQTHLEALTIVARIEGYGAFLLRTIPAQLQILNHAVARINAKTLGGGIQQAVWSHERDAINLANAILHRDTTDDTAALAEAVVS